MSEPDASMKVDVAITEHKYASRASENPRDKSRDNGRDNREFSRIRIAEADEEDDLVRICKQLHQENGSKYFSLSETKVRANLRRAFNKQLAMVPVIGGKGKIEAIAYLSIEQFAWSDDWHLSEWFNYVLPEYRASQHARALLIWERDAAEISKKILWIGVTTEVRLAAKLRLYRRVFGERLFIGGRPPDRLYDSEGKRLTIDIDHILAKCGCAGAYFVFKPKSLMEEENHAAQR